jgi:siroheme synthase
VHVVPGISAANGCAAYAGIALTHRDCAHSVTFVVAHQRETAPLDWPVLARPAETLVFFMPLSSLERISRELMLRGLPPSHPAALVAEDTTPRQRVWETTLAGLPALAATSIRSPALLIVGQVVRLRVQRKSPGPTSLLMRDSEWCSPVRTQGYG